MLDVAVTKRQGTCCIDVAFGAQAATVTALFGRSGAGKTSLIEMVAGLKQPDSGRIVLDGRTLFDAAAGLNVAPQRRRIGYVFQDGRLFPHFTVRSNLVFGRNRTPPSERFIDFAQVVDLLGIAPLLDRRPGKLSGGEKQRVAIGRALLTSPRLLLMDEPLASLDGARKAELLPFIAKLCTKFRLPIVYVTHSVEEVLGLADHLVLVDQGRILASGPLEEVMALPDFALAAGKTQLTSVLRAAVDRHDATQGTTVLTFAGGAVRIPSVSVAQGRQVRLRIDAGNVILALAEPHGLSVQNVLPARIADIRPYGGLIDVLLDVGSPLHAEITPQACSAMGLAVGMPLFALIKSASISQGDVAEVG